jgi:hypothetical protein
MQKVTTMEPLGAPLPKVNPWIEYSRMTPEQQNKFLGELLNEGRLSKSRNGNYVVFSNRSSDGGMIFNPTFTDGISLYFVNEEDVIAFIDEKKLRFHGDFSYYRLCVGKCQH